MEATNRSRAQQLHADRRSPSGLSDRRQQTQQLLAPYKQEVARSSRAPPILTVRSNAARVDRGEPLWRGLERVTGTVPCCETAGRLTRQLTTSVSPGGLV